MRVRPTYDRVVVKVEAEKDVTEGGIVIPQSAKNPSQAGVVLAVGPGRNIDAPGGYVLSGFHRDVPTPVGFAASDLWGRIGHVRVERPVMQVKVGDRVLWGRHAGTTLTVDGEEVHLLREDEILAVIDPQEEAAAESPAA